MKRGEIYWAELHPRSGSEQQGHRPVLVVSHDAFNQTANWRSVIVVPLSTSHAQAKRGPTAPLIPKGTAGLKQDSVALAHQITTLDRAKLTKLIGSLPYSTMQLIELAIKAALQLI